MSDTHRVPTRTRIEARRVIRASKIIPFRDSVERPLRSGGRVQPWIQPTKRCLPCSEQAIVQQRNDARERRRRSARPADADDLTVRDDLVVPPVRGDVRVRTPGRVVEPCVGAAQCADVGVHGGGLVGWLRPVVGEATCGEVGGLLGDVDRRANGSDAR